MQGVLAAMSHIIVDGYNLIGIFHRDPEKARRELITDLSQYRKLTGHNITVVFDGHGGMSATDKRSMEAGVEVIFTRIGKRADDLIIELSRKLAQSAIVISSDREVADSVWRNGSVPVKSEVFADILEQRLSGGFDLEEEGWETDSGGVKGRGRKPSKRERAIMRAVKKL